MLLTQDQKALQEAARKFTRDVLLPDYQAREAIGQLDDALLKQMGALGFVGPDIPEEFGGMGLDAVSAGVVMEELAYGDFNIASYAVVQSLCGAILVKNASSEIKADWLPSVCAGEKILALSVTEPQAGSDASGIRLKAERDGEYYVLSGEKASTTFSDSADAFIIFARTSGEPGQARGISAFFVPSDSVGLSTTRYNDLGSHVTGRGSLFLDQVRVPVAHLLGAEGKGFSEVMAGFDYSRALIALQCIGAAQASVDEAWSYSKEREAFGAPIAQFQGVTFPLVEAETHLAAARALSYRTLALRDQNEAHTVEAAMVKWLAPKTAVDVIHQCLLTFGHYGWSKDLPHQQRLRDVMGLEIGDGMANIMKMIVARARVGAAADPRASIRK